MRNAKIGFVATFQLGLDYVPTMINSTVKDVSALANVHCLDLSSTEVEDVSMLSGVHSLDLSWTKVKDISAVRSIPSLKVAGLGLVVDPHRPPSSSPPPSLPLAPFYEVN